MRITEACPLPAAQQLLAHIRDGYGTIPKFCEAKGLDRLKVARALNGELTRFDVDFALDVQRATGGAVGADGWRVDEEMKAAIKAFRARRKGEPEFEDEPKSESRPSGSKPGVA